jgi:GxxExxY protein
MKNLSINELTEMVIGLAIKVHRKLGPGFLESVYQAALAYELEKVEIPFEREKELPVMYEDVFIDVGFRTQYSLRPPCSLR